jgi:hypothetical protein
MRQDILGERTTRSLQRDTEYNHRRNRLQRSASFLAGYPLVTEIRR